MYRTSCCLSRRFRALATARLVYETFIMCACFPGSELGFAPTRISFTPLHLCCISIHVRRSSCTVIGRSFQVSKTALAELASTKHNSDGCVRRTRPDCSSLVFRAVAAHLSGVPQQVDFGRSTLTKAEQHTRAHMHIHTHTHMHTHTHTHSHTHTLTLTHGERDTHTYTRALTHTHIFRYPHPHFPCKYTDA